MLGGSGWSPELDREAARSIDRMKQGVAAAMDTGQLERDFQ